MSESVMPRFANGLREVAEAYDLFLLDQYGVLHDGEALYPGALEALAALREAGKALCVLSNSGRSAAYNAERLERFSLPPSSYGRLLTSGDMAVAWLKREAPETRCYAICPPAAAVPLREAGLHLVEELEQAELLLLISLPLPVDRMTPETLAPVFEAGLRRRLPMICANPDLVGPKGDRVVISPGRIAADYRAAGGAVRYFGKPEAAFFAGALSLFPEVRAGRAVMIVDTPETDLIGARAAGIAAIFLTGGVHAAAFAGLAPEERRDAVRRLLEEKGASADWVLPALVW